MAFATQTLGRNAFGQSPGIEDFYSIWIHTCVDATGERGVITVGKSVHQSFAKGIPGILGASGSGEGAGLKIG